MNNLLAPIGANTKRADRALYDDVKAADRIAGEKQNLALAELLFNSPVSERLKFRRRQPAKQRSPAQRFDLVHIRRVADRFPRRVSHARPKAMPGTPARIPEVPAPGCLLLPASR